MSELTPELLVKSISNELDVGDPPYSPLVNKFIAEMAIRKVLKAIQDGEVAEGKTFHRCDGKIKVHLKPSYQKFLESGD